MAYLYEGIATTQKGKIIYRREKHPFGSKDLLRIIKKIGFPDDAHEIFFMLVGAIATTEFLRNVPNDVVRASADALQEALRTFVASSADFEGYGGGEFGGAGASGTFRLRDIFGQPLTP